MQCEIPYTMLEQQKDFKKNHNIGIKYGFEL